eukprot:COSAG05_NODE_15585_length_366_cov_0.584270_1_plen_110_part_00
MWGQTPDLIPSAPLLPIELETAKSDCSQIDLPFHRVTALMGGLYSRRVLGANKPTLRRTLYTVFNLETHAFSTASHKKKKRSPLMQGIYLQDVRGLNFHMVLERLALLH